METVVNRDDPFAVLPAVAPPKPVEPPAAPAQVIEPASEVPRASTERAVGAAAADSAPAPATSTPQRVLIREVPSSNKGGRPSLGRTERVGGYVTVELARFVRKCVRAERKNGPDFKTESDFFNWLLVDLKARIESGDLIL